MLGIDYPKRVVALDCLLESISKLPLRWFATCYERICWAAVPQIDIDCFGNAAVL